MRYDVTIGIPVYRSEPYIRQTLESALAQSYPSIEFLIVDDCSDDNSLDIIREICKKSSREADIHVICHAERQGPAVSRNRIIERAQGRFLYFMDSDDVITPEAISLLMAKILQYDAEIAFGSYVKIDISGQHISCQYPSVQLLEKDQLAVFSYRKYAGIQASACNYLVSTDLLRVHYLRFIDTDYWEDLVFTNELVTYVSRAVLLPDITYYYYCREGSLSHYQNRLHIEKKEVLKNVKTLDCLKAGSIRLRKKVYYPNRCLYIVMTDFYIACSILRHKNDITPSFSTHEIKMFMSHPASFREICLFRESRMKNMLFFLLGRLPASLCVWLIRCAGKMKNLI